MGHQPGPHCLEPGPGGAAAHTESLSVSGRAIDDKYSRREEYRGFTQDFKEKDGYKPDVKIEYVDETGRKLTPKEVSGASEAGPRGRAAPQGLGWGLVVSVSLAGPVVPLAGLAGGCLCWPDPSLSRPGPSRGSRLSHLFFVFHPPALFPTCSLGVLPPRSSPSPGAPTKSIPPTLLGAPEGAGAAGLLPSPPSHPTPPWA